MAITIPFHRVARPHVDGSYTRDGRWAMIRHPAYAQRPHRWVRAFMLIQHDLVHYLESVEPADENLPTYSLRGADLLVRTCIEVEANLNAILRANTYAKTGNLNMADDYFKIETSHFLSQFEVQFPYWDGSQQIRRPFEAWGTGTYASLPWYGAYNKVKHDRAEKLSKATFLHLTDAWCGLVAVLTAQFLFEDFDPGHDTLALEGNGGVLDPEFEPAIGSFLGVKLPGQVPVSERYEFTWSDLQAEENPFAKFDYDNV